MRFVLMAAAALLILTSQPRAAEAALGQTNIRLNVRAGPGTYYPVIGIIPPYSTVNIIGCVSGWKWCDVMYGGFRGWVAGNYLRGYAQGYNQYLPVTAYGGILGLTALLFNQEDYWTHHYRDRDFFYRAYPAYRRYPYYHHRHRHYDEWRRERWDRTLERRRETLRAQRERAEDRRERIQERRQGQREDARARSRQIERQQHERQRDWRSREWQRERWNRSRAERREETRRGEEDRRGDRRRRGERDDGKKR